MKTYLPHKSLDAQQKNSHDFALTEDVIDTWTPDGLILDGYLESS